MSRLLTLALALAAAAPAQKLGSADEARATMAALLKIGVAPPPVAATLHSAKEEDGLVIEDVSWESLDGERVPAYLIRPAGASAPLPAVICLHGSSGSRESETTKQFGMGPWLRHGQKTPHQRLLGWARELARHGYITLTLTQRGLDRRLPDTNDQSKDLLVRGRTLMGALVHEIRQGVTYLQQRKEVRSNRIGMTGMSFGGITTFYTWIADPRVAAAAPICGGVGSVDVFLRRGSRGYHGFYWWIPDMLSKGDQGDFAAAMAARPLMLWAPLSDIGMPKEGVDRFLEVVQPAYAKTPGALVVHRPPGEHEFTLEAFGALKEFLDRFLKR
ncbi:MAG: dienelactone hydrolase family protein [Acidobacteria bacterium]|nr:dienelactone hydrolase family protein [Acidobacteriota bacterium]